MSPHPGADAGDRDRRADAEAGQADATRPAVRADGSGADGRTDAEATGGADSGRARAELPTAPAGWERLTVEEPPVSVIAFETTAGGDGVAPPGTDGDARVRPTVRDRPAIATESDGAPALSYTLVLERQPRPDEDSIRPLIERGVLRFDVTLAAPQSALRSLECSTGDAFEPLYARRAEFSLVVTGGGDAVTDDERTSPDAPGGSVDESAPRGEPDDEAGGKRVLDAATATGTNPTASLGATLDRDDALAVVAALNDQDGALAVRADVRYRPPSTPRTIALDGSWVEIYDVLAEHEPADGALDREALRAAFLTMVERGVVTVAIDDDPVAVDADADGAPIDGGGDGTGTESEAAGENEAGDGSGAVAGTVDGSHGGDLEAAFDLFVRRSGLVLRRTDGGTDPAEATYALGSRPPTGTTMRVSESVDAGSERTLRLQTPLADALGDALAGSDLDGYASAIAVDGGGRIDDVAPILERVDGRSAGETRSNGTSSTLAVVGSKLTTVDQIVSPSDRPSVSPHAEAIEARPVGSDIVTKPEKPTKGSGKPTTTDLRDLPHVTDSDVPVWPAPRGDEPRWYAPVFEPVEPDPSDDPEAGPFSFEFERHGTTAEGEPGLRGRLRFTLEPTLPNEAAEALTDDERERVEPVVPTDAAVEILVPYEDAEAGTRTQRLEAAVSRDGGTLTAEVEMANRWVRLCYGALALPDFQDRPVRVRVKYAFEGYEKVYGAPIEPVEEAAAEAEESVEDGTEEVAAAHVFRPTGSVAGIKRAVTPVVAGRGGARSLSAARPVFDTETATVHTSLGALRFGTGVDAPDTARADADPAAARRAGIRSMTGAESRRDAARSGTAGRFGVDAPRRLTEHAIAASDVAIRPKLQQSDMTILPVPWYEERSFTRSGESTLSYPCDDLGALYRERTDDGSEAIGCRNAFALGETSGRQYEELTELRHDRYRVYLARAQPHRFLVVPKRYRIGRRAPGSRRAYQPSAIVYAVLEPESPADSKVVFEAGLQPELPTHLRRALRERLADRVTEDDPDPILEYPTDVFDAASYRWAIDGAFDEPTMVEAADHLRLTATVDVVDAHLLRQMLERNGLHGRARFELSDGTSIESDLALELSAMTGPWRDGPLAVEREGDGIRLTNRVASTVSVAALRRYDGTRLAASAPVERTLSPDETTMLSSDETTFATDDAGVPGELVAVYEERAAEDVTLEESRVYVEDVTTNVIFVTDFDPDGREVSSVEVQARLRGVDGTNLVPLQRESEGPFTGSVAFTLPLTRYLEEHVLEFRATTVAGGEEFDSGWLERDLRANGTVVPLDWALLAGEATRAVREAVDRRATDSSGASPRTESLDAARERPAATNGDGSPTAAGATDRTDPEPDRRDGTRRRSRRTGPRSTSSTTTEEQE